MDASLRPVVLITGAGRSRGIGAAIARRLATEGWDVAFTYWAGPEVEAFGSDIERDPVDLANELESLGARTVAIEADFADTDAPAMAFNVVERQLGPARALIVNHTLCVVRPLLATTAELFDRHLAVNARGALLLIQEFANRYKARGRPGTHHFPHQRPHGRQRRLWGLQGRRRSIDRRGRARACDPWHNRQRHKPGPVDTGWMTDENRAAALARTPLRRASASRRHRRPRRIPLFRPGRVGHRPAALFQRRVPGDDRLTSPTHEFRPPAVPAHRPFRKFHCSAQAKLAIVEVP